jgi:hypothetical protein
MDVIERIQLEWVREDGKTVRVYVDDRDWSTRVTIDGEPFVATDLPTIAVRPKGFRDGLDRPVK